MRRNENDLTNEFRLVSPSFQGLLKSERAEQRTYELSLHQQLTDLAKILAEKCTKQEFNELQSVLDLIEIVEESGDKALCAIVETGFLESFQEDCRYFGVDPDSIFSLLGDNTKKWWNDLSKNWAGNKEW